MSPEVAGRIAVLKQKALDNTLSLEDMKEAVRLIRGDRAVAQVVSTTSRTKRAKAEIKTADEMLDELGKV